jgi:hypothetical protein
MPNFSLSRPSPWKYLALYEIETDDLAACLKELADRVGMPLVPMSDTLDPNLGSWVFHPIHPLVEVT